MRTRGKYGHFLGPKIPSFSCDNEGPSLMFFVGVGLGWTNPFRETGDCLNSAQVTYATTVKGTSNKGTKVRFVGTLEEKGNNVFSVKILN